MDVNILLQSSQLRLKDQLIEIQQDFCVLTSILSRWLGVSDCDVIWWNGFSLSSQELVNCCTIYNFFQIWCYKSLLTTTEACFFSILYCPCCKLIHLYWCKFYQTWKFITGNWLTPFHWATTDTQLSKNVLIQVFQV